MGLRAVTQSVLIASLVTAVTALSTYFYQKWKKSRIPSEWEKVGFVKKLHLYPLKSGHRVELERAEVTDVGLRQTKEDEKAFQLRDRGLVVYGAKDYEFRTARTYPKMVLIDVSVHDEHHLAIDAPTMRTLYVKIPNKTQNNETSIKCWDDEKIYAIDCGDEAATWFSRYIIERDSGLRLGYNDASQRRDITKSHQKLLNYYRNLSNDSTGLFSDLSSILLINQHSVNDMNKKIANSTVTVDNFRPNIVVDGPELKPYDEDEWDWLKIGDDLVLRNVKECTRCILTTINPDNGVRNTTREPLKTLETYRRSIGPSNAPTMGVNLGVRKTGFVKVGDPVYVSKKTKNQCWRDEWIYAIDCGDEAAKWFSRYLLEEDSGLGLGYNDASNRRDIIKPFRQFVNYYKNLGNDSTGLFAELCSVSVINQQSVDDMNQKMESSSFATENFRASIVVDGPNLKPYDEDHWDWLKIGDQVVLRNVMDCTRCIMINIDPVNGVRNPDREPLKTLETYRRGNGPSNAPVLGIYLGVKKTGFVKVGDEVYISRKAKNPGL